MFSFNNFLFSPLEVGSALDLVPSVCPSVSSFVFEQLTKLFDIFASGWHIFLKSFGDIPRMFLHYFQIIPYFLYVCQAVSWLSFLLKLDKYRDISRSGLDIFLKFFGGPPGMFVHLLQILLNFCMSVSRLIGSLSYWYYTNTGISLVLDEISFWNLLKTFLGNGYTSSK